MLPLLLWSITANYAWAKTVEYNWHVGWVLAAPDGYVRPVMGVNGKWPVPTIEANVNDTIIVNAYNGLGNESMTLHFHGMYQKGTAADDGAAGLSQCGIEPGSSFRYKFKANPAGTHWWHSHEKGQYPDGLRGKMIIHNRTWERSLKVHKQYYLSMSDWYHKQQPELIRDYLSPDNINGTLPSPDAFLFNERSKNPATLKLKPGKRYLLRIVNLSGLVCGAFHINKHPFSIVAVDGIPVKPRIAHTIAICAGQRFDVVVEGDRNRTNYIAKMETDVLQGSLPSNETRSVIGEVSPNEPDNSDAPVEGSPPAEGVFNGSRPQPPGRSGPPSGRPSGGPSDITPDWNPRDIFDDATLIPLDEEPLLGPVDVRINVRTNKVYYPGIGSRIGLGRQPWIQPKVPSLLTALTTGKNALDPATYGPGVDPHVVRHKDIVDIYMENPEEFPHPMHLHGHSFQLAGRGEGSWNGSEAALHPIPVKRDVATIMPGGWLLLRFRADNPGVWFFHCHIDLHLVGGMAATIIEAPDVLQRQQAIPLQNIKSCNNARMCSVGACNCRLNKLSPQEAEDQCNTIFNSPPPTFGALKPPKPEDAPKSYF